MKGGQGASQARSDLQSRSSRLVPGPTWPQEGALGFQDMGGGVPARDEATSKAVATETSYNLTQGCEEATPQPTRARKRRVQTAGGAGGAQPPAV